jgi:hypothetical protein
MCGRLPVTGVVFACPHADDPFEIAEIHDDRIVGSPRDADQSR